MGESAVTGGLVARFRGFIVSVDYGADTLYQGEIEKVDTMRGELTLARAVKNGTPMGQGSRIKLSSAEIKDIRVYKRAPTAQTSTEQATCSKSVSDRPPAQPKRPSGKDEFRGCLVTVDCEDGRYQGIVEEVNMGKRTITLNNPLRDGYPLKEKRLMLASHKIFDIHVVKMPKPETQPSVEASRKTAPSRVEEVNSAVERNKTSAKPKPTSMRLDAATKQAVPLARNVAANPRKKPQALAPHKVTSKPTGQLCPTKQPIILRKSPVGLLPTSTSGPTGIPQLDLLLTSYQGKTRNPSVGPSGIPALDAANGYKSLQSKGSALDKPLDTDLLQQDFDFDANLAKFDQIELSDKESANESEDDEDNDGSNTSEA